MKTNRVFAILAILSAIMMGTWALESQNSPAQTVETTDFDATDSSDYPVLTNITVTIDGIASYGKIYMLEGIENSTAVKTSTSGVYSPGATTYPRLIFHGVFSKNMRDWRDKIIAGTSEKHDIKVDLFNKAGKKVLRVTFYDTMPMTFALPPLSVDNSTRYQERVEFIYTNFAITNN